MSRCLCQPRTESAASSAVRDLAEPIEIRRSAGRSSAIRDTPATGAPERTAEGAVPAIPGPRWAPGPVQQDNFNVFGFRVNPPDQRRRRAEHCVEMINLVFGVYDKTEICCSDPLKPAL
jgi:hypothetical protein